MGGGYGQPEERPPERVYQDYLDGFITIDQARESYSVVITADGIDEEATRKLRSC